MTSKVLIINNQVEKTIVTNIYSNLDIKIEFLLIKIEFSKYNHIYNYYD